MNVRQARRAPALNRLLVIVAMLAATIGIGVTVSASPAFAATTLCSGFTACNTTPYNTHGWDAHYTSSYWGQVAGDNCTNYVAYYEQAMNGMSSARPSWLLTGHNADSWASEASGAGITVSSTPVVGAVAQWGDFGWNGNAGHVGIVEAVSNGGATVTVSWDSYPSGPYKWVTLNSTDVNTGTAVGWPQNFIYMGGVGSGGSSGSGHVDLAWFQGSDLYTFTGSGLGTTGDTAYYAPSWGGVGDYNKDGRDDLFLYNSSTRTIYWMSSNGSALGANGIAAIRTNVDPPTWAAVGDFDGDGYRNDLVWFANGNLYTFMGSCGLCTTATATGYYTPTWAGVGDYNHDGKDDLFLYDGPTSTIYWMSSDGTGVGTHGMGAIRGPGVGAPTWAGVGDFTHDGYRDSIAWFGNSNHLYTFTGSGLGTTGDATGYTTPTWAGVGDYDHDGKSDLILYNGPTSTILWASSDGTAVGTHGMGTIRAGVGTPDWAGVGNFE